MLPHKPLFLAQKKKKPENFSHVIANKLDTAGQFSDGLRDGYIAFYDLDEPRPTPLDGPTLERFIAGILNDADHPAEWKSGYIVGWSAAMGESKPEYFFLEIFPEGGELIND